MRGRPRITPDELARMEALYLDGLTLDEIATDLGRTREGVRLRLIEAGLHVTTFHPATAATRQKAVDWYERGVEVKHITRRLGVSATTLYDDLRRQGVPLRLPRRCKQ